MSIIRDFFQPLAAIFLAQNLAPSGGPIFVNFLYVRSTMLLYATKKHRTLSVQETGKKLLNLTDVSL